MFAGVARRLKDEGRARRAEMYDTAQLIALATRAPDKLPKRDAFVNGTEGRKLTTPNQLRDFFMKRARTQD